MAYALSLLWLKPLIEKPASRACLDAACVGRIRDTALPKAGFKEILLLAYNHRLKPVAGGKMVRFADVTLRRLRRSFQDTSLPEVRL